MNLSSLNASLKDPCPKELVFLAKLDLDHYFIAGEVIELLLIPPTIILNLLVLVGVYKTPSLHSPSNVLLCGLALTDLGAGAIAMPLFFMVSVAFTLRDVDFWCNAAFITNIVIPPFAALSFLTVTFIGVDRVIALYYHMRYGVLVTNKRVVYLLVFIWVVVFLVNTTQYFYYLISVWCFMIGVAVCLVVSPICNILVFLVLRRHRIDIQSQQQHLQGNHDNENQMAAAQRRKTSSNMIYIYLLFVLCCAPFSAVLAYRSGSHTTTLEEYRSVYILYSITYVLMYLNSFLNPIFYCIRMRSIRKAMWKVIPNKIRCLFGSEAIEIAL